MLGAATLGWLSLDLYRRGRSLLRQLGGLAVPTGLPGPRDTGAPTAYHHRQAQP